MAKYQWEVKPPITRPEMASPVDWEIGNIHAADDAEAIRWAERLMKRFAPEVLKISCENRAVRTFRR